MIQPSENTRATLRLDLGEQAGRLRFAELLSRLRPGTLVTVVIGGETATGSDQDRPAPATSFAQAMRQVEASVYDVA